MTIKEMADTVHKAEEEYDFASKYVKNCQEDGENNSLVRVCCDLLYAMKGLLNLISSIKVE